MADGKAKKRRNPSYFGATGEKGKWEIVVKEARADALARIMYELGGNTAEGVADLEEGVQDAVGPVAKRQALEQLMDRAKELQKNKDWDAIVYGPGKRRRRTRRKAN